LYPETIFNNGFVDEIVNSHLMSLENNDRSHLQLIWDLWKDKMPDGICPVVKRSGAFLDEWKITFSEADFREGYLPFWRIGSGMDTNLYPCLVNENL